MAIRGEDGYRLLREKLGRRRFWELVSEAYVDGAGFHSDKLVTSELLETYGYLPYVGERHICEFFSCYLAPEEKRLETYKLKRTSIEERREGKRKKTVSREAILRDDEPLQKVRSRETAADIIAAIQGNGSFVDVVNLPNEGQIPNLPLGSIVETLGVMNGLGFAPMHMGPLPEQVVGLVLPHVRNQDAIVEAGLEGDLSRALRALYQDPLCSHLTIPEIHEMGLRLLRANAAYLPQFAGELEP